MLGEVKHPIQTILRRPTFQSSSPQSTSTSAVQEVKSALSHVTGTLKHAWRRISENDFDKETVFVLAWRNYKEHVDLRQDCSSVCRYTVILATPARSFFTKKLATPPNYVRSIWPIRPDVKVQDVNNCLFQWWVRSTFTCN